MKTTLQIALLLSLAWGCAAAEPELRVITPPNPDLPADAIVPSFQDSFELCNEPVSVSGTINAEDPYHFWEFSTAGCEDASFVLRSDDAQTQLVVSRHHPGVWIERGRSISCYEGSVQWNGGNYFDYRCDEANLCQSTISTVFTRSGGTIPDEPCDNQICEGEQDATSCILNVDLEEERWLITVSTPSDITGSRQVGYDLVVTCNDPISDVNEPNESATDATDLGDIDDRTPFPAGTVVGLSDGASDEDWFTYTIADRFGGAVNPKVALKSISVSQNLDVCMMVECDSGFDGEIECGDGSTVAPPEFTGVGCCSTNSGESDEVVSLKQKCSGTDDAVKVDVVVFREGGTDSCDPYELLWGDN